MMNDNATPNTHLQIVADYWNNEAVRAEKIDWLERYENELNHQPIGDGVDGSDFAKPYVDRKFSELPVTMQLGLAFFNAWDSE